MKLQTFASEIYHCEIAWSIYNCGIIIVTVIFQQDSLSGGVVVQSSDAVSLWPLAYTAYTDLQAWEVGPVVYA